MHYYSFTQPSVLRTLHCLQVWKERCGQPDADVIHQVEGRLDMQRLKDFSDRLFRSRLFEDLPRRLVHRNTWTRKRKRRRTVHVVSIATDVVRNDRVVASKSGV